MPGFMHRRAKARRSLNGCGIHVLGPRNTEDVDGRDKPGHDKREALTFHRHARA